MPSKLTILITGANQGIGYHAAHQLAATGKYTVLLGARDITKGQRAVEQILSNESTNVQKGDILPVQIDLSSDESIAAAVRVVEERFGGLDILVHNAAEGANTPDLSTREQYLESFNTNSFGPVVATEAFLPLLRKSDEKKGGKRIIFLSSLLASSTATTSPAFPFPAHYVSIYRASKAALNMSVLSFASLLGEEGFTVCALDPGYNKTRMTGFGGDKDPSEGARVIPMAIEAEREEVHGRFVHFEGGVRGFHDW
ncbi:hypothetical protein M409DRAFT_62881 [Zasmidium cellare ATCC 36951]|uniref:NAD(P)-binding protein n=1 Tax=Zasmidium cellare ATCC 36951 TaxID=1080233 RepID=A0A6A6CYC5_ZASCE|nr:uncharacterized protein M409DRAFT_62881 [Zasmidium cellare ATCC 36951]KAF2172055.1 hypothetical protein M409DRAFT_62881 [Zasmidium cellare ATCC 36951]